jgi:hypothetical protein
MVAYDESHVIWKEDFPSRARWRREGQLMPDGRQWGSPHLFRSQHAGRGGEGFVRMGSSNGLLDFPDAQNKTSIMPRVLAIGLDPEFADYTEMPGLTLALVRAFID